MDTVLRITLRAISALMCAALLFASWPGTEALAAQKKQPPKKAPAKETKASTTTTTPEPEISLFSDATFMLPKGSRVSAHWVLPPTEKNRSDALISVDASGSPVIGYDLSSVVYLMNPVKEFMIAVEAKISGFTHLDNGLLLLAAGNDIGLLAEPKQRTVDKQGVPIAGFQPLTSLHLKKIDLLSSVGNTAYCAGFNPQTGRYALYLLNFVEGAGPRDLELIHESADAITAVTGNNEATFIAKGTNVFKVSRKDGKAEPLYTHPSSAIKGLAITPAGLLVSTYNEIVLAGENGAIEIMRSSGHRIAERNGTVHVFFNTSMGVLAIENLADLKRFNLAVRPVAPGEVPPPLAITSVRFFESGPPPYTIPNFAESFASDKVRRIVSQIDFKAASVSKDTRQHMVTVSWYEPNGGNLLSASYPVAVQPRSSTGQIIASIGGKTENGYSPPHWKGRLKFTDSLANHYPGQYRMLVHVDGVPAGEWSFNLTGPVKPADAISYDDLAMLQTLLTQGLSPRNKEDGEPILNSAVKFGSTRAVELLLKNGADPNDMDKEGVSPLAECGGWLALDWRAKAELLIRHGANVNALVGKDKNPLVHHSSFNPDFTVFLVEKGANIYAQNSLKENVWESAARHDRSMCTEEFVTLLLKRGADLNAISPQYPWNSFLGNAISSHNYDCASLLLNKGASVAVVKRENNRPARSALYMALETLLQNTTSEYGKKYPESITAGRRIIRLLISRESKLTPGKKLLTSSIFYIEDFERQLNERSNITHGGETRIMFRGEALSFFDTEEISRTLDQDDAALDAATESSDPAIRELALKNHLGRVRELTYASRQKSDLIYFVHDHCKKAFKLAEARYKPMQLDVVPDISSSVQNTQNTPILGIALLKRDAGGAYIQRILPGSAAAKAGLRTGDIILALDTQKMKNADEIISASSRLTPGMPVRVTFLRDAPMLIPELPLTCGVLEKGIDEKGLAEMNLTRWLAENPDAPNAQEIRALLNELSGTVRTR